MKFKEKISNLATLLRSKREETSYLRAYKKLVI